jgi:subtilisin family serine protease
MVVCAGQRGRGKVGYPAAYPGRGRGGATQFDEAVTFYSNYGKDIDIAAPGGNTRVDQNGDGMPDGVLQNTIVLGDPTKDDYFGYMGTSMASPHVAGVAALIVGEGVTDPKMVEEVLQATARPSAQTHTRDTAPVSTTRAAVLKARSGASGWSLGLGLPSPRVAASMKKGLALKGLATSAASWSAPRACFPALPRARVVAARRDDARAALWTSRRSARPATATLFFSALILPVLRPRLRHAEASAPLAGLATASPTRCSTRWCR